MTFFKGELVKTLLKRVIPCFLIFILCLLTLFFGGDVIKDGHSALNSPASKTSPKKSVMENPGEALNPAPVEAFADTPNNNAQTQNPSSFSNQSSEPISQNEDQPIKTSNNKEKANAVTILYYHAVDDNINGIEELFISPAEFEKQMKYLSDNGYTVITFDDIDNADKFKKPVIITFDDGYEDNYTNAYPILKKHNYKATIFLCTDVIDKPQYLKKNQILEMSDLINIQSHTVSHRKLTEMASRDIEYEMSESKNIIENITSREVSVLAYPYGSYNNRVVDIAKKYYKYAVTTERGMYQKGDNKYAIKRVYIPRQLDLEGFIKKINAG